MRQFVQVRPNNGFLIHAVPADTEGVGHRERYSNKRPICGKIQAKDAQRLHNLVFQTNVEGNRQPFTATMLQTADKAICITCAKRVAWASSH